MPAPCRPVDEPHADDDAEDHSGGRHGESEVLAGLPVQMLESFGQPRHGAVPALESDFQKVAELNRNPEQRQENQPGHSESDRILSPCNDLPEAELGRGDVPDAAQFWRRRSEEKRGEHDVDQEAGERIPSSEPVRGEMRSRRIDEKQSQHSADHRGGKIELLKQRNQAPQYFTEHKQQTKSAERHDNNHCYPRLIQHLDFKRIPASDRKRAAS